jgi:hypothetical protein
MFFLLLSFVSIAFSNPDNLSLESYRCKGDYWLRSFPFGAEKDSPRSTVVLKFEKTFDRPNKFLLLKGYPKYEYETESSMQQPFTLIVKNDHAYLLQPSDVESVQCRKVPIRFENENPLHGAKYHSLMFQGDTLCHKYTNVNIGKKKYHEGKVKLAYSEMYVDPFTQRPTEVHLEGVILKPHKRGEISRFVIDVSFEEFSMDLNHLIYEIPSTIENLCEYGELNDEHEVLLGHHGISVFE